MYPTPLSSFCRTYRLTLQTVFYAYQGLRHRRAQDASWASDSLYYSLALVGLCSAFFHGLVKFYAQLCKIYRVLI
jgi:hypothetical protein